VVLVGIARLLACISRAARLSQRAILIHPRHTILTPRKTGNPEHNNLLRSSKGKMKKLIIGGACATSRK